MIASPDFMGTLPGWITAASSTTGVTALIIAFWKRGVSLKGLQDAKEGDIRDHYAEELERVLTRQRECEGREEKLRERVRNLEDQLEGLYRTIVATSAEKVIELGDAVPEHIRDLAQRTLEAQRTGA